MRKILESLEIRRAGVLRGSCQDALILLSSAILLHCSCCHQCPFTLAPSRRLFMLPRCASGRPPKRQRLNASVLARPASKSAASSMLSSDCSRVISCGDWFVCAFMSSSCAWHYTLTYPLAYALMVSPEPSCDKWILSELTTMLEVCCSVETVSKSPPGAPHSWHRWSPSGTPWQNCHYCSAKCQHIRLSGPPYSGPGTSSWQSLPEAARAPRCAAGEPRHRSRGSAASDSLPLPLPGSSCASARHTTLAACNAMHSTIQEERHQHLQRLLASSLFWDLQSC